MITRRRFLQLLAGLVPWLAARWLPWDVRTAERRAGVVFPLRFPVEM